jgi:folate-binding protein YgfZ
MSLTALQVQMQAVHGEGSDVGRVGEYRGATAALSFAGPQSELKALRAGCGVYDLGFRALISLTGGDRVRWLNGMVTNNIRDLAVGRGVYSFLLNPQGRILGDLYAYNRGESIIVETDRSQVEKMLATFDHYIIMDDVEVADVNEQMTSLGISGPNTAAVLRTAGIQIPEMQPLQAFDAQCTCDCDCTQCTVVKDEQENYQLWVAPGDVKKTWDALLASGATAVGFEALEMQRILSGIPLFGVDIRERDLPQETAQDDRALNFSKGCYVGQEIVERIRSRGAVHRKFAGFLADVGGHIESGGKIISGDKEVGEITSVARLDFEGADKTVALGYIRREVGLPGREVAIGASKASVMQLPFAGVLGDEPKSPERPTLEHEPVER